MSVPPGFSLIANPYYHNRGTKVVDAVPDNSVGEILKAVPEGTLLFKFDNATGRFSENRFRGKGWSHPDQTLSPGEGAFIFIPHKKTVAIAFSGNCGYGGSVQVPAGLSLISSPDCGTINFAPLIWSEPGCPDCPPPYGWDSLSFSPQEGDVVYTFDSAADRFKTHTFRNGAWDEIPVVSAAQSCFVLTSTPRVIRWAGGVPQ
jgi:hypothetical protein